MVTYTFTSPFQIAHGSQMNLVTITAVTVTEIRWSSTPPLAPVGTQELDVTLTDTTSGWQEKFSYQDASIATIWTSPLPAGCTTVADAVAWVALTKLQADGKLQPGTISVTSALTGQTGAAA